MINMSHTAFGHSRSSVIDPLTCWLIKHVSHQMCRLTGPHWVLPSCGKYKQNVFNYSVLSHCCWIKKWRVLEESFVYFLLRYNFIIQDYCLLVSHKHSSAHNGPSSSYLTKLDHDRLVVALQYLHHVRGVIIGCRKAQRCCQTPANLFCIFVVKTSIRFRKSFWHNHYVYISCTSHTRS